MTDFDSFRDTPLQWYLRKPRLTDQLKNLTFVTPTEIETTPSVEWEKGWDEIIEDGDLP